MLEFVASRTAHLAACSPLPAKEETTVLTPVVVGHFIMHDFSCHLMSGGLVAAGLFRHHDAAGSLVLLVHFVTTRCIENLAEHAESHKWTDCPDVDPNQVTHHVTDRYPILFVNNHSPSGGHWHNCN